MNERFIYLQERFFENELTENEKNEFNKLLIENPILQNEFNEQKRIKEVLKQMQFNNPSKEVWDGYWLGIYRRIERGLSWILISFGAIILIGFAIYQSAVSIWNDISLPIYIKFAVLSLIFGLIVLTVSILREKLFTLKKDKYKEIQRWFLQLRHH